MDEIFSDRKPYVIAGPCSAESPQQLEEVVKGILDANVDVIRAGIWKPRSRPGSFEGKGKEALKWLSELKATYPIKVAVEVANPVHVEASLKAGVDILWLGARTTVNPFTVQEIAESLKGVDKSVLVKNPINPDLALWLGAIERIQKAEVASVGAVHRGFSSFQPGKYRNAPMWQIPVEMRRSMPGIPLFCDPSHIAGDRNNITEVCQSALDFNYDGLMIEVHPDPENALSDPLQQITPGTLKELLKSLKVRSTVVEDLMLKSTLQDLREQIDEVDRELIEVLARRMNIIDEIGKYKKLNNITVFQLERWKEIVRSRPEWGEKLQLTKNLVEEIFKDIHTESMKRQTDILNRHD